MRTPASPVITLLTDFGIADYYVPAMKGVILSLNPRASVVDITHEIPPQDIEAGAFTLLSCYRDFPHGTIHVAVVDPGVGSARRPIVVSAGSQFFVGPDNGLFSYIYENEPSHKSFQVTAEKYFRQPVSSSFHGRDIFAPVAAALSKGVKPKALGPRVREAIRLAPLAPVVQENGKVKGRIIHIDHFGSCITNFTRADVPSDKRASLRIKRKTIRTFREFFSEDAGAEDEVFAIWSSSGFLELAANRRSASEILGVQRGEPVVLSRE